MMIDLILAAAEGAKSAADAGPQLSIDWSAVGMFVRGMIACVLMIAGLIFVLAGSIGVLRLPDFYTRLHAAGMTDTLGVEFILMGLIVQAGVSQMSLKLALVGFLLLITSPTATHAVAHAAWAANVEPLLGKWSAPTLTELEDTK